jgi:hypothetical protein
MQFPFSSETGNQRNHKRQYKAGGRFTALLLFEKQFNFSILIILISNIDK